MDKIQIAFFFISGYFISRVLIAAKVPEKVVETVLERRPATLTRIIFYVVALSALLSIFIPNAITVLTLLPILELLRQACCGDRRSDPKVSTPLALAVIYGANIGGIASATGTPANGIFISFLEANNVAGTGSIHFATWLAWGLPLTAILIVLAWLIIIAVMRPWRVMSGPVSLDMDIGPISPSRQKWALGVTGLYLLSSTLLSLLMLLNTQKPLPLLVVSGVFTAALCLALFFAPLWADDETGAKQPLLVFSDCFSNMPVKGFILVGVAVVLAMILYALQFHIVFAKWVGAALPRDLGFFAFLLIIALCTSFSTEVLSNTAVQIALFLLLLPLAAEMGFSTIKTLLVVTLSCTCAFMSPIATGVNGLAFGGVKGVSLTGMLIAGTIMNVVAGLVITYWVFGVVPW